MKPYSYEDAAAVQMMGHESPRALLAEYVSGADIVGWYGRIEAQLVDKLEREEGNRNTPYADKIRAFLKLWRENEIRGSLNREPIDTLKAATDILAVDDWNLASYFRSLRDSLRALIARIEELPYDSDAMANDEPEPAQPMGGGMPGAFGPEKESPPAGEPKPGEAGGPRDQFDLDKAVGDAVAGNKGEEDKEKPV